MRCCRKLLELNPNNHRYHEGLQAALQLQPDAGGAWSSQQREALAELYAQLAQRYPRANAVRRIPLDFKVDFLIQAVAPSALPVNTGIHAVP